jgi:hypothetical protein
LDSIEAQCTELQYQLQEAKDCIEMLTEELAEMNRKIINSQKFAWWLLFGGRSCVDLV